MIQFTVLGGSGFLGSELSDLLVERYKSKVKILDIKRKKKLKKNQIFIKGNIFKESDLIKAIRGSEYVFNFAALSDLDEARDKPLKSAIVNIIGTIKSLVVSKNVGVKKFIHASSIYANSEQGGFYGSSKRAAEDYIERFWKKYKLKYTIIRFGSLYGLNAGKSNGINFIIDNYIKNKTLVYEGKKNSARRYIHVNDACEVCLKSIGTKLDNKYINVTGRKKIKVYILMKQIAKLLNYKKKIIFKNLEIEGHYVNEPKKFKPRESRNIYVKKYRNLKKEIALLIKERKKII